MSISTTNDNPYKIKKLSKKLHDDVVIIITLQDLIDYIKKNTFIKSEIIKCIISNINCDKLKYITILLI